MRYFALGPLRKLCETLLRTHKQGDVSNTEPDNTFLVGQVAAAANLLKDSREPAS